MTPSLRISTTCQNLPDTTIATVAPHTTKKQAYVAPDMFTRFLDDSDLYAWQRFNANGKAFPPLFQLSPTRCRVFLA